MSREYKHYEIRPVRNEFRAPGMSGLVSFVDAHGQGELYTVAFSDSFVKAVGKVLPRGVSANDPAFIYVLQAADGTCSVYVSYIFEQRRAHLMWKADSKPSWLKYRSLEKKDAPPRTTRSAPSRASTEVHAAASGTRRAARAYPQ